MHCNFGLRHKNTFILARKVCNAGIRDSKTAHEPCGQANGVFGVLQNYN